MATALVNPRQPLPRNPRVATAWHPALRAKLEYLDQPTYDSVSFNNAAANALALAVLAMPISPPMNSSA